MFSRIARMITILGGGCAVLVAGEIMLGEKSTPLSHDPELRAMERAPDLASSLTAESFCPDGKCPSARVAPVVPAKNVEETLEAADETAPEGAGIVSH